MILFNTIAGSMPRSQLFGGLSILACTNGLGSRAIQTVNRIGWADAFLNTFEISAIVFVACAAGIWLILRDNVDKIRPADLVVVADWCAKPPGHCGNSACAL
jgi:hypothetical protein